MRQNYISPLFKNQIFQKLSYFINFLRQSRKAKTLPFDLVMTEKTRPNTRSYRQISYPDTIPSQLKPFQDKSILIIGDTQPQTQTQIQNLSQYDYIILLNSAQLPQQSQQSQQQIIRILERDIIPSPVNPKEILIRRYNNLKYIASDKENSIYEKHKNMYVLTHILNNENLQLWQLSALSTALIISSLLSVQKTTLLNYNTPIINTNTSFEKIFISLLEKYSLLEVK
jgi:hypothetical protein